MKSTTGNRVLFERSDSLKSDSLKFVSGSNFLWS